MKENPRYLKDMDMILYLNTIINDSKEILNNIHMVMYIQTEFYDAYCKTFLNHAKRVEADILQYDSVKQMDEDRYQFLDTVISSRHIDADQLGEIYINMSGMKFTSFISCLNDGLSFESFASETDEVLRVIENLYNRYCVIPFILYFKSINNINDIDMEKYMNAMRIHIF